MKYIDRIIKVVKKYQSFDELKREIEARIRGSDVSLERIWIGTTDYYVPCVAIGRKKYKGIEIPRRVFQIWIYTDRVKVIDMDTGEYREKPL